MSETLVTIVVPVYNVEKYLDRCIESLVNQTHRNLEIILVDDCSPDLSPQMCDEWARRDSRIAVIHKEKNEGQGIARNNALDVARGKYVCFLDSDDYIVSHTIERVLNAIEQENAQLAVFGLRNISADGKELSSFAPQVGERTYRGKEVLNDFLPDFVAPDPSGKTPALFYMSSCLIMYSTPLLRNANWHFVSERKIISEDVYSLLNLMDSVTSVTIVPEALYCYCCNDASFSRKYTPGRYEKIKAFYLDTLDLCKKKNYSREILHRITEPYISYTLATLKQEAANTLSVKQRIKIISSILKDETLQDVLSQRQNDCTGLQRKIIFSLMRKKWAMPCFLLFRMKN